PVPVEDVRAFPRGRQVGVLDRSDTDGLGDRVKLGRIETCRGVELDQDAARAVDGLLEQVAELDVVSGPGPEPVAVRAEDQAYLGVLEAGARGYPARLSGHREHHLEVQRLNRADHVDGPVDVEHVDAVP